ncbi:hypothetical protein [Spiroplasma sp. TIUS-1]|uniref:hypothetical protein n=1 Tax=Spiroplasma sp. TIUS-1 TaxID=216963 RepID=UPI0013A69E85|nr:hypothetical protein [Spiroplasma sp. TIUS-1]
MNQKFLLDNAAGEYDLSVGEFVKAVGEFKKINVYGHFWDFNFNEYLLKDSVKFEISNITNLQSEYKGLQFFIKNKFESSNNLLNFTYGQKTDFLDIKQNLIDMEITYIAKIKWLNIFVLFWVVRLIFDKLNFSKKYLSSFEWIFIFVLNYLNFFEGLILKILIYQSIKIWSKKWDVRFRKITKFYIFILITTLFSPMFIVTDTFYFILIGNFLIVSSNYKNGYKKYIYMYFYSIITFAPIQIYFYYKIQWLGPVFSFILIPYFCLLYFVSIISIFIPLGSNSFDIFLIVLNIIVTLLKYLTLVTWIGHYNVLIAIIYYSILLIILKKEELFKVNVNFIYLIVFVLSIMMMQLSNFIFGLETNTYLIRSGYVNNIVQIEKRKARVLNAGTEFGVSNKNEINSFLDYKGIKKIEWVYIQNELAHNSKQLQTLTQNKKINNLLTKTNFESFTGNKIINFPNAKTKGDKGGVVIINNNIAVFSDISLSFQQYILNNKMYQFKDIKTIVINKSGDKWTTKGFIDRFKSKTIIVNGTKEEKWDNKVIWNSKDYIKI